MRSERTSRSRSGEESARPEPGSETPEDAKGTDEPLRLVHHHAGYLRVRTEAFLRPDDASPVVAAARTAAEAVPGFRSWSLNPKTGSVVIEYEPGALEPDDLLKHIAKSAGFRGVEVATPRKMSREEVVSSFLDKVQGVNQTVSQLTGGRADLRELTPAALAVVSVVSFIVNDERGRLPHWMSALYRGYRIFMQWHRPEVRTRERTARQEEERTAADKSSFPG
jgi:heavy-metal-associated domain-containing protein